MGRDDGGIFLDWLCNLLPAVQQCVGNLYGDLQMTDSHFLVLAGMICIAPHYHPIVGNFAGLILLFVAAVKGLGWL